MYSNSVYDKIDPVTFDEAKWFEFINDFIDNNNMHVKFRSKDYKNRFLSIVYENYTKSKLKFKNIFYIIAAIENLSILKALVYDMDYMFFSILISEMGYSSDEKTNLLYKYTELNVSQISNCAKSLNRNPEPFDADLLHDLLHMFLAYPWHMPGYFIDDYRLVYQYDRKTSEDSHGLNVYYSFQRVIEDLKGDHAWLSGNTLRFYLKNELRENTIFKTGFMQKYNTEAYENIFNILKMLDESDG